MAFKLSKVINGEVKTFTQKKFLEIIGEPENDEVFLDGDAYRISSFVSIEGTGSGSVLQQTTTLLVGSNNQTIFSIPSISDPAISLLYVNGVLYTYGLSKTYHINGMNLYWHGPFALETTDTLELKYYISI